MTEERREAERVEPLFRRRLVDPDPGLPEDRLEPACVPDRRGLVQVQRVLRRPREQELEDIRRAIEGRGQDERPVRGAHAEERRVPVQDRARLREIVLLRRRQQLFRVPHRAPLPESGRERGLAPINVATAHVTTCVSPHDGHMTSIGRRLVDRSIGLPQRRQVIDIGEVGVDGTGPSGGGGGTALPPIGPKPPPTRLQRPITASRRTRNKTLRTIAKTGKPATSVDQNAFPDGPTWTVWNALAPVLISLANTTRPPFPVPPGIVRKRSALALVVMAETLADAIDRDHRNWLGSDAGPFAVRVRRAGTLPAAAYHARAKLTPRTKPVAWLIIASAWVLFPRSVAVTRNV